MLTYIEKGVKQAVKKIKNPSDILETLVSALIDKGEIAALEDALLIRGTQMRPDEAERLVDTLLAKDRVHEACEYADRIPQESADKIFLALVAGRATKQEMTLLVKRCSLRAITTHQEELAKYYPDILTTLKGGIDELDKAAWQAFEILEKRSSDPKDENAWYESFRQLNKYRMSQKMRDRILLSAATQGGAKLHHACSFAQRDWTPKTSTSCIKKLFKMAIQKGMWHQTKELAKAMDRDLTQSECLSIARSICDSRDTGKGHELYFAIRNCKVKVPVPELHAYMQLLLENPRWKDIDHYSVEIEIAGCYVGNEEYRPIFQLVFNHAMNARIIKPGALRAFMCMGFKFEAVQIDAIIDCWMNANWFSAEVCEIIECGASRNAVQRFRRALILNGEIAAVFQCFQKMGFVPTKTETKILLDRIRKK